MSSIPLSFPDITEHEIQAVVSTLRSGRLTNGPRQARFEEMVADRAGRSHGIAVSSGTAGLHLVLQALDIRPGDEVITTPFSFVASANCILYTGATPVFVDIDPTTLNIDPTRLEAAITAKTKAIIAVEAFGNAAQMDRIAQVAGAHEIPLIEDSCEGLGGQYKGRPIGGFGRAGVFGFYSNKQITTGEGGIIVTDDDRLASTCRSLRNQGRIDYSTASPNAHDSVLGATIAHDRLGYNYRLSELASALGIAQMERLNDMLAKRRQIAGWYINKLIGFGDLVLPTIEEPSSMSWFAFVVRLSNTFGQVERDRVISGLRRHDIGASNYFPAIHLLPFYRERFGFEKGSLPIAESISDRTIALPFYNRMDETTVELVVQTLKVMLQRERLLKPGNA